MQPRRGPWADDAIAGQAPATVAAVGTIVAAGALDRLGYTTTAD